MGYLFKPDEDVRNLSNTVYNISVSHRNMWRILLSSAPINHDYFEYVLDLCITQVIAFMWVFSAYTWYNSRFEPILENAPNYPVLKNASNSTLLSQ